MFSNWKSLSKRTRIELLSGRYGNDFERVVHISGWKGKVKAIVERSKNSKKLEKR